MLIDRCGREAKRKGWKLEGKVVRVKLWSGRVMEAVRKGNSKKGRNIGRAREVEGRRVGGRMG